MRRPIEFAVVPLLVLCVGTTARAQGFGSNSGDFLRRFHYDLEFITSGDGAAMQRSKVLMLLSRGQVDTLRPSVDSAITNRERRSRDSAAMVAVRKGRNSAGIPMGGHWYWAEYNRDSVFVLGQAFGFAGRDSVVVVMVDRADRIGGDPVVIGAATFGAVPAAFWGLVTDPPRQGRILASWLRRSPPARAFLR